MALQFLNDGYFAGSVGIGEASPSADLHVNSLNDSGTVTISRSGVNIPVSTDIGSITFASHYNSAYTDYAAIQAYSNNISALRGSLDLKVKSTSGNLLTGMTVYGTNSGVNVGIGTTSPTKKLEVVGSAEVVGTLYVEAANNNIRLLDTNDSTVNFSVGVNGKFQVRDVDAATNIFQIEKGAASNSLYIDEDGNVGIGTTGPSYKLDVNGTFGVSDLPFNTDSVSVLVADETLGPELVTNGNFDSATGWNLNSNWTISGGTCNADGTSNSDINQNQNVGVIGEKYRISYVISAYTQGTISARIGNGVTDLSTGTGTFTQEVTATTTDRIRMNLTGSFIGSVDSLSIKQITSASNQIQKRELGTGAFGPTPVGAYLPLAGGTMTGDLKLNDNVDLYLGTGNDFQAYHDGSNTYLRNLNGSFIIKQDKVDADLVFQSDDGAGGTATYMYLDGSIVETRFAKDTRYNDNIKAKFGDAQDLQIYHDGSNSYINEVGTGSLIIKSSPIIEMKGANNEYLARFIENGSVDLYYNDSLKFETTGSGVLVLGDVQIDSALLSNQENTDIDTGTETVASVAIATYTAAFFDFVIKKTTNVRSGTVYACHDGTNVEFTETSTQDLGDTSDVTLSVDISGGNMRLRATTTSDDWSVKSLIRAI